jgi:hypothetical protein
MSSPDADKLFKQVLTDLTPVFKKSGFRKSSQNFSIESDECWAVINFQKSRWSDAEEKTFYINVAVTAKRLMAFEDEPTDKAPPYYSCLWSDRAEQFGPDSKIQQWTVRDEESVSSVVEYLRILLQDFVIPAVKSLMSEEALLAKWTNLSKLGYPQLKAKTVFLAGDQKLVELRDTIFALHEAFGKGAVAQGVLSHMEQLRTKFPDVMRDL